jgi:Flp pilus assembly protein TadG
MTRRLGPILRRRAQHGHLAQPGAQPRPAAQDARAATRRPAGRGWRSDEGAGAAELVIAVPLLMLLILLIVQFAVWAHASSVAQATAEEALAAARVQGGSAAAGQQRAQQVLAQIGGAVLPDPHITVTRSAVTATVEITGTAERVLPVPGLALPVTVTVTGPVERFVPAGG